MGLVSTCFILLPKTEYVYGRHRISFEAFLSQFSSVLSQIKGKANVDYSYKVIQYFGLYQEKPFTLKRTTYSLFHHFATAYCAIACVLCLYRMSFLLLQLICCERSCTHWWDLTASIADGG